MSIILSRITQRLKPRAVIISLNRTKGWIVSGHGYGMYTYVNPNELDSNYPNDMTIGLYGRSKRNQDGLEPIIIHINSSKK